GGRLGAANAPQGLRAACETGLSRLRPRFSQLSLEQLPLAADHHQLGRVPPADGWPAGLLLDRSRNRLGDHLCGNAHDLGAAARRLPAVPAPVRAELHARRYPLAPARTGLRPSAQAPHHAMYWPPLASRQAPVMKPASSAARKVTQRATSSAVPSRPTGICGMIFVSRTSFGTAATISVAM